MLSVAIKRYLKDLVDKYHRILFLGIGENRMGDDGFGPYVSYELLSRLEFQNPKKTIQVINGKTNYVERKPEIQEFNPELLILIDTCKSDKKSEPSHPGRIVIAEENELINWLPLSSHVLPLPVFITQLKSTIKEVFSILIGIEPISQEYNNDVVQYKAEFYSLDDYEKNPDLPFYEFNLSPKIQKRAEELIDYLLELLV
ncbi:MAG: hydrogenase maturation protease [Candidatus Lokiarchaeota archaeon]|nr:hydrogenase maturation protease [Candidatus Lokiarchaeota archaeon]